LLNPGGAGTALTSTIHNGGVSRRPIKYEGRKEALASGRGNWQLIQPKGISDLTSDRIIINYTPLGRENKESFGSGPARTGKTETVKIRHLKLRGKGGAGA